MATRTFISDPREIPNGRAAASQRIATRMELAEMLRRVVLPLVTVYPDGEADLLRPDADDAASDLLSELEHLGYAIVREPRQ